jgi:hypothetical protein
MVEVMAREDDQIGAMSSQEQNRILGVLNSIGGPNITWTPQSIFEFWTAEHRMASERQATARLAFATWALVATTAVLVLATGALVFATLHHG